MGVNPRIMFSHRALWLSVIFQRVLSLGCEITPLTRIQNSPVDKILETNHRIFDSKGQIAGVALESPPCFAISEE